jgi:hypothetical protein
MTPQRLVLTVLLLVLLPGGLGAQERWLRGVVVRLGEHNEKLPEANIPIRFYGHGNPTHTDSHGAFRLTLPDIFKVGEKVTLEVDKPGWRIHYPLEGETRVPADLAKEVGERSCVNGKLLCVWRLGTVVMVVARRRCPPWHY